MNKVILIILLIISLLVGFFVYGKIRDVSEENNLEPVAWPSESMEKSSSGISTFGKYVDDTSKWKTIKVKDMTLYYPSDWPTVEQSEIIENPYGFQVQASSPDGFTTINVMTDMNGVDNPDKLDTFLGEFTSLKGKMINVDGNKAAQSAVTPYPGNDEQKVITSYINAPDKRSQYILTLQNYKGMPDEELSQLFNTVISKVTIEK